MDESLFIPFISLKNADFRHKITVIPLYQNDGYYLAEKRRLAHFASLVARTRITKQSTGLFLTLRVYPVRVCLQTKLKAPSFDDAFTFGGEEETRTPAPVTRPTPLAGAPRHQLEYFSESLFTRVGDPLKRYIKLIA